MKHIYLLFILFSLGINGQSLIHTKGNKAFGASYHYTPLGSAYSVEYLSFFEELNYWSISVNYETGNTGFSDFNVYLLNPSYGYSPWNAKQKLYLNIETGALLGWENRLAKFDFPLETKFLYGFNALIEAEFFITPTLSLNLNYSQMLTLNSSFGLFRYQIGSGLKLYF